jgi:hypothetical protein
MMAPIKGSKGSESFEFEISEGPSSRNSNDSDPFDRSGPPRVRLETLSMVGLTDEMISG